MIRAFIVLELPDDLKNMLVDIRENFYPNSDNVKWESKNKLHITLKFLGDTDENMTGKISEGISQVLQNYKPFQLSFARFGIFKREDQPKIFWAGFDENMVLTNMAKEIDQKCEQFGFQKEKRNFRSHLTLLRIRGNEKIDLIYRIVNTKFESLVFFANAITFYKSDLKPSGSEYTAIEKFYLKKE